jgi:hypothetical protein
MKPLSVMMMTILLAGPALASPLPRPAVIDKAKLFSPQAVERANKRISAIRQEYHIDLCIDALTELPDVDPAKIRPMGSRERDRLYRGIAEERADEAGVDGIYVLVTTNPGNVVLVGWPGRRNSEDVPLEEGGGLSYTKRDTRMRKPFVRELGQDHDQALLRLVDHFSVVVQERISPPPSPLETMEAVTVVGVLVGVWVLLFLLRRAVARRQAATTGEPCRPIYQPAMLGSLFGVPAAFWIYDRLFRSERPAHGVHVEEAIEPPHEPTVAEESPSPAEITEGPVV